jgi:hypothetical protein
VRRHTPPGRPPAPRHGKRTSIEATLELIAAEDEDIDRPRADPVAHQPNPAANHAHPSPERGNNKLSSEPKRKRKRRR